jgi:hypothetical protein
VTAPNAAGRWGRPLDSVHFSDMSRLGPSARCARRDHPTPSRCMGSISGRRQSACSQRSLWEGPDEPRSTPTLPPKRLRMACAQLECRVRRGR